MPISVRDIYDQVCDCILEPGTLTGETITEDQFLSLLNQTLNEVLQLGPYPKIFINQAELGVRIYPSPGPVTVAKNVAVDSSGITMNSGFYWDQANAAWQNQQPGNPQEWRQDQLDEPSIEVRPAPSWTGYEIEVTGGLGLYGQLSSTSDLSSDFDIQADPIQPDGFLGTVSEFDSGNVYVDCAGAFFGVVSDFIVSDLNITQFSISAPEYTITALDQFIPDISDIFLPYIRLNIMRMITSTNSESKNLNANKYLSNRCLEGQQLMKTITDERQTK